MTFSKSSANCCFDSGPAIRLRVMTAWGEWHDAYSDPTSDLSQRLAIVQDHVRTWLDDAPLGPLRIISMCAGQGHDLIGALRDHDRRDDVTGLLVELDSGNVAAAQGRLTDAGLSGVRAVRGDAGRLRAYTDAAPAHLILVCGVFGNVSDQDVHGTISALPMLLGAGGTVVWTRHRRAPDLTDRIRAWFQDSDFDEESFDSPGPGGFSVGRHRFRGTPRTLVDEGRPLFSFAE